MPRAVLKDYPHHLMKQKKERRQKFGRKNLEVHARLFKYPNFSSLLWIGENLEVYTAQDNYFKIKILNLGMNREKLCPNFSFTVKNDYHFT